MKKTMLLLCHKPSTRYRYSYTHLCPRFYSFLTLLLSLPRQISTSTHAEQYDAVSTFNRMFNTRPPPRVYEFNKLLSSLARKNHYPTAISLFTQMEQHSGGGIITPCLFTLTIMITCYSHVGHVPFAFSLLGRILKRGYPLDTATLNALIKGLCVNGVVKALDFHNELVAKGFQLNEVTYGTLINGLCQVGQTRAAIRMLKMIEGGGVVVNVKPNAVMYSTVIENLCREGLVNEACDLYNEMVVKEASILSLRFTNIQKMENSAFKNRNFGENEQEEIPDSFCCCVCLDLLYKPIVLSCGHICCFWCVYKSMNCLRESQCPICRHQYYHFPTVCQMLHFLLLKIYPVAYKRRINQTIEEEKKSGFYSPQLDPDTCESQAKFGHSGSPSSSSMINQVPNSCNVGTSECMEQPGSTAHEGDEGTVYSEHTSDGEPEIIGTPVDGKKLPQDELCLQQKISVADVMCTMCKQLLFHPVVLNCGHVYCETCVLKLADELLRCQVCQSPHPRGFPKVCLEFDHFLEEQFPEEYARRRDAIELKQIKVKPETPSSCSLDNGNKGENVEWWSDPDSKVHIAVGCDFCGMYPIIGDRYRCIDCKEKMGFDLCSECYDTRSKRPGRFNQQHTSEHRFKLVPPNIIRNIMLRLVTGQLGDSSVDSESLGNLEFTTEVSGLSDDGEDNQNDPEATN